MSNSSANGKENGVDRSVDLSQPLENLSENEAIKADSDFLRGTIVESLEDRITGQLLGKDHELTKFHGIYEQDDRDQRNERRRRKLEPAFQFMIRVRLPGGVCQPGQWSKLDEVATEHANGTLRLTTRQTFQFHGVLKRELRATIQGIHEGLLDTIGACGDGNRGVMASPLPELDGIHEQLDPIARQVSEHLLPRSRAYHEIWLEEEPVYRGDQQAEPEDDWEREPLYGPTYLPRKFKIGFAVPPVNDVDVFTQDIGFIAIAEGDDLVGFNVTVGGGMGRTDNENDTYPRLGDVIGFCEHGQAVDVAEKIVTIQRDYGNRQDRKVARMKYTIDRLGLGWFVEELHRRLGYELSEARPFGFETSQDQFGWSENQDGTSNYTLFVENGRVQDTDEHTMMTGLREIARVHEGDIRVTPNQNLIIARIPETQRAAITGLLDAHGILDLTDRSNVRRHSMACVAFPTCGLAMAESERYFPDFMTRIEALLAEVGLEDTPIVMRMSGCNNGCSRPYVAEVGFSGRAPGKYNMYLGGGFHGERIATPYLENVGEETILDHLRTMFEEYAEERKNGEHFGDFVVRKGHVEAVNAGAEFNDHWS